MPSVGATHNRQGRPFRIGIWCDYGYVTLIEQGIGVFVQNLIRGLLALDEPLEIVVLARPGDARLEKLLELKQLGAGRLTVIPEERAGSFDDRLTQAREATRRAQGALHRLAAGAARVRWGAKRYAAATARAALRRPQSAAQWIVRLGAAPLLVAMALLAVVGFPLWRLTRALAQTLAFPLHALDNVLQMASDRPRAGEGQTSADRARAAQCDAWLVPYVGLDQPLELPTVLAIHDLVHVHYRDTFPAEVLQRLDDIVPQRASEATLCACMSDFILRHDLEGVLRLPPSKTRCIRPAAPEDFPAVSEAELRALQPAQLTRPYLLFPAAFRPYKNHSLLIDLLRELASAGEDWLDVVFTGFSALPAELAELIARRRLEGRVHALGFVDRRTLAALYRRAFATFVPSLYEQGSFPIYEALSWSCPVACSSIPSLREQCASMGSAMLYFDPRDPRDAARTVLEIRDRRAEIIAAQQAAKATLWQRTWRDAAAEWLTVLKESAALHAENSQPGGSSRLEIHRLPRKAA